MLCYEIKILYDDSGLPFGLPTETRKDDEQEIPFVESPKKSKNVRDQELEERMQKLNSGVNTQTSDNDFYAVVYREKEECLEFCVLMYPKKISLSKVRKKLVWAVKTFLKVSSAEIVSCEEITTRQFATCMDEADNRDYLSRDTYRSVRDIGIDYFDNSFFKVNEELADEEVISKDKAIRLAKELMADQTLLDEIDRIYATENSEKFYGYPVHYRVSAGSREAAMPIIRLMMQMLHSRNRILGTRISLVSEIEENCYDETDLLNVCKNADGSAVVIELRGSDGVHGNFAASYEAAIRYVAKLVKQFHQNTLFFFLQDVTFPGFSNELISAIGECVDLISICEGSGNRMEAGLYFKRLIGNSVYSDLQDDSFLDYLPNRRAIKSDEVYKAFNTWSREVLRNKAYSAYKTSCIVTQKNKDRKTGSAYEKLQAMVGLSDVKKVTDQIIASYKMQTLREEYGMGENFISKHMVFTGNPGSAKTSVARLIADILTDEGVLKSGALVECGRADLVGKYVGWTAKQVRKKFKEAEGGMLFIDEAYSLVDDSHSFGDEAINTIVQEMENRRGSIIVVFAGYTDKMNAFLDKNEGLRSRIAFHLDFPDYNEEELMQIMDIMLKERGLKAEPKAKEKALRIFSEACKEKDYGNGRFVRNVVEQAMLKQAQRLMKIGSKKKVSKLRAQTLYASDFEINVPRSTTSQVVAQIGFAI